MIMIRESSFYSTCMLNKMVKLESFRLQHSILCYLISIYHRESAETKRSNISFALKDKKNHINCVLHISFYFQIQERYWRTFCFWNIEFQCVYSSCIIGGSRYYGYFHWWWISLFLFNYDTARAVFIELTWSHDYLFVGSLSR